MALFAQGSKAGARALDWLELRFRRRFPGAIQWWKRLPRAAKIFIGVAWPTTVGTLLYLIYRIAGEESVALVLRRLRGDLGSSARKR